VKLPNSAADALELPFCRPSGYGPGKAGCLDVRVPKEQDLKPEMLFDWLDESYRAVSPKTLLKRLPVRLESGR
jgi:hypothetical protein